MASSASKGRTHRSEAWASVGLALSLALAGCASAPPAPAPAPPPVDPDAAYLVSPLAGYPLAVDPATARRIEEAHRALVDRRDRPTALRLASELLERSPDLHPAIVLAAQADVVDRRHQEAVDLLLPVAAEYPTYRAAQLLLGRASERAGDLPGAVEAFSTLGETDELARQRLAELRPRAVEILGRRIGEALARNRVEDAGRELDRLRSWAPDELVTLEAGVDVARALEDPEAELAALRGLAPQRPDDRQLIERQAELEMEVGDPSRGLRTFQDLADADPEDPVLADKLARAKFRWRLQLLPAEVQELARQPQLARGEFAAVLYWLFPDVRYGRVTAARIANDILDHPHREAIARVVNLGLMAVDADLHQFAPDRPLYRVEALGTLLRLMTRREPRPACLGGFGSLSRPAVETVCRATVSCGLLPEEVDCLPGSVVSGDVATEMSRKALERLGVE